MEQLCSLFQQSEKSAEDLTVECTVVTGFEFIAESECRELFGLSGPVITNRGRIFFNVNAAELPTVFKMRSVDNVILLAGINATIDFTHTSAEADCELIKKEINEKNINKVLNIWKKTTDFQGITFPTHETYQKARLIEDELKFAYKAQVASDAEEEGSGEAYSQALNSKMLQTKSDLHPTRKVGQCLRKVQEKVILHKLDNRKPEEKVLRYRVTCNRVGKHSFGSQDAAKHFGGQLQNMYHWVVDLSFYDAEFILNIREGFLYYGLALTESSMHRRNIACFGATTLRATICYSMLRMSSPAPGDIVVDPLCGGGSIPIEGSLAFPASYYLCGDIHEKAISLTRGNLQHLRDNGLCKNNIDQLSWDATCLPLRDASVDIVVSDLPFGKRSGSVKDNRILYKDVLSELGRVVRAPTGRAALLTHDTKSLHKIENRVAVRLSEMSWMDTKTSLMKVNYVEHGSRHLCPLMLKALASVTGIWWPSKTVKVNIGGLLATVFLLKRTLCIERLIYMKKRAKKAKHTNQ